MRATCPDGCSNTTTTCGRPRNERPWRGWNAVRLSLILFALDQHRGRPQSADVRRDGRLCSAAILECSGVVMTAITSAGFVDGWSPTRKNIQRSRSLPPALKDGCRMPVGDCQESVSLSSIQHYPQQSRSGQPLVASVTHGRAVCMKSLSLSNRRTVTLLGTSLLTGSYRRRRCNRGHLLCRRLLCGQLFHGSLRRRGFLCGSFRSRLL